MRSKIEMANVLGCDSLRFLPIESLAKAIGIPQDGLCQACVNTKYPTPAGQKLYQLDRDTYQAGLSSDAFADRAFDAPVKA